MSIFVELNFALYYLIEFKIRNEIEVLQECKEKAH